MSDSSVKVTGGPAAVVSTTVTSFTPSEFMQAVSADDVRASVPLPYVARMEEAQIKYTQYEFKHAIMSRERTGVLWALGFESIMVAGGGYLVYRGYRFQASVQSMLINYMPHYPVAVRLTTPYALAGFFIVFLTSFMVIGDLGRLSLVNRARAQAEEMMGEALRVRDAAYREGLEAAKTATNKNVPIK